ncbi:hypothetical protein [Mucilaginibacter sp.]
MNYPFKNKIEALLNSKSKTKEWLSEQMGFSARTLYNRKNFAEFSLQEIVILTKTLEFDFLKDYNAWLKTNSDEEINLLFDPPANYKKGRKLSINLRITGISESFKEFDKVIDLINKQGEKYGFEIE